MNCVFQSEHFFYVILDQNKLNLTLVSSLLSDILSIFQSPSHPSPHHTSHKMRALLISREASDYLLYVGGGTPPVIFLCQKYGEWNTYCVSSQRDHPNVKVNWFKKQNCHSSLSEAHF